MMKTLGPSSLIGGRLSMTMLSISPYLSSIFFLLSSAGRLGGASSPCSLHATGWDSWLVSSIIVICNNKILACFSDGMEILTLCFPRRKPPPWLFWSVYWGQSCWGSSSRKPTCSFLKKWSMATPTTMTTKAPSVVTTSTAAMLLHSWKRMMEVDRTTEVKRT